MCSAPSEGSRYHTTPCRLGSLGHATHTTSIRLPISETPHPPSFPIKQHRNQRRNSVQNHSTANDRLVLSVLAVGEGQAILVDQAAAVHTVVQCRTARCVLNQELAVVVSDHYVGLVVRCVGH